MQNIETQNESSESQNEKPLTKGNGNGTLPTVKTKQENKIYVAAKDFRIAVSQEQFESVKKAHTDSLNLLDSCGNALLNAMQMAIPPEGSGRMVGEYTGQNLRQMAKSVCDIVQTKTGVVRSMYQISRDEV